jgi:hypothetical protein
VRGPHGKTRGALEGRAATGARRVPIYTAEEGGAEHIGLDHLPHVSCTPASQ